MPLFGQSSCIQAKWLYSGKVVLFVQKWLYTCKRACIRAKMNVFGLSGFIEAKVVVIVQGGCIRANWL